MRKVMVLALVTGAALAAAVGALAAGGYGDYGDDMGSSQSGAATTSTAGTASTTSAKAETYSFKATLTGGAEVPKPNAPPKAGGAFTAKSTESGSKVTLRWTLTFHGLSGKAMAAHVHMGKKGKAGPVVVPLCGPCKSGQHGSATIPSTVETALEKGTAYVNVHTAKNAAGEIRGQVKLTGK
jgi:hypothetical protein